MKTAIIHDKPQCIGCGACVALDPQNWSLEPEGRATLKQHQQDNDQEVKEITEQELLKQREVAEACPVNCIHLYDKGKKLL